MWQCLVFLALREAAKRRWMSCHLIYLHSFGLAWPTHLTHGIWNTSLSNRHHAKSRPFGRWGLASNIYSRHNSMILPFNSCSRIHPITYKGKAFSTTSSMSKCINRRNGSFICDWLGDFLFPTEKTTWPRLFPLGATTNRTAQQHYLFCRRTKDTKSTKNGRNPTKYVTMSCFVSFITNWFTDHTTVEKRNFDLVRCLLVSQRLHNVTISFMYQDPKISRFPKFHRILQSKSEYGTLIRSLDISSFRAMIPIPVLQSCLSVMPLLGQLRLMLEDLGDNGMLRIVFGKMQYLKVLEIDTFYPNGRSDCTIPSLIHDFFATSSRPLGVSLTSLTCNLRYASCSKMFEAMLPHMSNLKKLNVAHTDISYRALRRIANVARITYLDVSHCRNLLGSDFARFLVCHPAITQSLATLLASGVSYSGQLLAERDVALILSNIPPTLRSLNLGYSQMNRSHLPYLQKLSQQLEELGVGRDLYLQDIEQIFMSCRYKFDAEDRNIEAWKALEAEPRHESIFGPARDAVTVCRLKQRLRSVLPKSCSRSSCIVPSIRYLDMSSIPPQEQEKLKQSVLWSGRSMPLTVIEFSGIKIKHNLSPELCRAVGWRADCTSGRYWVVRQ